MPAAIPALPIVPQVAIARDRCGPVGKQREHDGERRRIDDRGPDALHRAHGDQKRAVARQTAQQRCRREHAQTDDEEPVAPVQVGAAPGQHQKPGQEDGVRADDPLPLTAAQTQLGLHRGQRDRDDREIDQQHEKGRAQQEERDPNPAVRHRAPNRQGDDFTLARNAYMRPFWVAVPEIVPLPSSVPRTLKPLIPPTSKLMLPC